MNNLENSYGEQMEPISYANPKQPTQSEVAALPGVTAVSPIFDSLERKVTGALLTKKDNADKPQSHEPIPLLALPLKQSPHDTL